MQTSYRHIVRDVYQVQVEVIDRRRGGQHRWEPEQARKSACRSCDLYARTYRTHAAGVRLIHTHDLYALIYRAREYGEVI